jgi:hypothetical protein
MVRDPACLGLESSLLTMKRHIAIVSSYDVLSGSRVVGIYHGCDGTRRESLICAKVCISVRYLCISGR